MNTKIKENFGKHLKLIRNEMGLTQEKLAEKAGVHSTYIGKIESGKSNPSLLMIYKISRALKIKLTKLFEFDK